MKKWCLYGGKLSRDYLHGVIKINITSYQTCSDIIHNNTYMYEHKNTCVYGIVPNR